MSDTAPDATGPKEVNPMQIDSGSSGQPSRGMTIPRSGERGPIGDHANFTPAAEPPGGHRPDWVADRAPVGSGEAAGVAAAVVEGVTAVPGEPIPQTEVAPAEQQLPIETLASEPSAIQESASVGMPSPARTEVGTTANPGLGEEGTPTTGDTAPKPAQP